MIEKEKIEKRRKEFAEELHAGSVYRDIQAREKERIEFEKRWFWELLQNAKDSVTESEKVDVKIEIKENEIAFSHTGNAFELDEILSLIIQGSSKTEDDNKIGRFGTGFMTTYLLSKKVEISGELTNNNGYFNFLLNRDAQDIKEFFKLQKISNDDFIDSIREAPYTSDNGYKTRFTYSLDEKGKITSQKGLKSLNELIPFTQLFNDQIDSITISNTSAVTTYEKEKIKEHEVNSFKIEEWKLKSSNAANIVKAYIIRDNEFDIVLVTNIKEGIERLIKIDDRYPKLFFTFPLIGTEELGIPFIINSTSFDPKIERDGIYLKSDAESNDGITKNKELIFKSLEVATSIFPRIIKDNNIEDVFNIFNFSISKNYNWIDHNWFNDLKNNQILKLYETECVLHNEKFKKLSDLCIPYSHNSTLLNGLWELLDNSSAFKVIPNSEIDNWVSIIKDHAALREIDMFKIENVVGTKLLIKYVSDTSSLDILGEDVSIDKYEWLNNLYAIVKRDLEEFPLNKRIVLNQDNYFVEAKYLRWDEIKDDELIDISKKLELNFHKNLISNDLKVFNITGVDNYTRKFAIEDLKNKINSLSEDDYLSYDKIQASALFLKWLIRHNQKEVIKDLKIISLEKSSDNSNVISQIFPVSKHSLLAPKDFFKDSYPLYSELIREKDCMHPVYCEILESSDFEWLDRLGFIHVSPLVKRKEKLDSNTIDLLIQNPADLEFIKDEDGKITFDIEMEFNDFAYLTTSVNHIYDRNSTTSSSLKIFNFLLNEATLRDDFFNKNTESIVLNNNETILFDKSLWLKRARNIQWVNVKNTDNENANKFSKEIPSSKNLSELIKYKSELIDTIRGEKQISFLSKINVGVSDLIRNTLASDEIRISWDRALTNMITSKVDPELVQEIFNDPGIQSEYKKRLNEKKLIKRNQQIGALVEQLFKELINKLKEQGLKVNIKREPFGSDFLLTDETSDLVNDERKREVFKINDWLVELKATRKDFAAMTSLQAETAAEKKDKYALIVIPLDASEPNIEYIQTHAKVVGNIGYKLSHLIKDFNDFKSKKNQLNTEQDGVSVDIENQNIRFKISSSVWDSPKGISISEFLNKYFNK